MGKFSTPPTPINAATTAEIADIANTESAGTSATYARGDHVHSGAAYQALSGQALVLKAGDFPKVLSSGTAAVLSDMGTDADKRVAVWLLNDAVYSQPFGMVLIPPGWATVNVDVWWSKPHTNAGNVVWRLFVRSFGDTESFHSNDASYDATVAAPSQFITKVSRLATGISVTPGEMLRVDPQRRGGDAGDTMTGDAALIAVVVTRAS